MPLSALGDYIEGIRQRHKIGRRVLSRSQMSVEAGLSINAISQIIKTQSSAEPDTLHKIAYTWGNGDEDYRALMTLAGHPMPEDWAALDKAQREMAELYGQLPPRRQRLIRQLITESLEGNGDPDREELRRADAFFSSRPFLRLWSLMMELTPAQRDKVVAAAEAEAEGYRSSE